MNQKLIPELIKIVGAEAVLYRPEDILVYEYDASFGTHAPDIVVLPISTEQVSQVVRLAARHNVPLVARGAGTGLSGGAIPLRGGILIVLTRMSQIRTIDYRNRRAVVEAGVINLDLVNRVATGGYTYAPDPGSGRSSTIGGNVASNAGGPHCLAYGVTANHVSGLKIVLPDGQIVETGGLLADSSGYDLTGVLVGSEGTLGTATEVFTQLMPLPETASTLLVVFKTNVEDASAAVSDILAHGIVPTAMEMMDGMVCRAVEAAVHAGYPEDAAGVLLIEVEGLADGLEETMDKIAAICREHHASEVRRAATAAERAALWTGRKGALGAMGRLAPNYYLEDGVVPRHKLPEVMKFIEQTAAKYDLPIGNFFHAGDGNIHPTILFDRRDPAAMERAHHAAVEILEACLAMGGAVSGEHGIGTEKQDFLAQLYSQNDLDAMADLRACFDPESRLNPGKIFPKSYRHQPADQPAALFPGEQHPRPASLDKITACLERIVGEDYVLAGDSCEPYRVTGLAPTWVVQPGTVEEVAAIMRQAGEAGLVVSPWGGGAQRCLGRRLPQLDLVVSMERLNQVLEHYPSDLTAAVQAGCTLQAANGVLSQAGQMLPLDAPLPAQSTLGGITAAGPLATGLRRLAYGTIRDMLLGIQVVRADGRVIRRGGMVVKNVAGYDMARLQYGALGTLGLITQLNLKLFPQPESTGAILAGFAGWPGAGQVVERLLASRLQPASVALFDAGLAAQLSLEQRAAHWVVVRYDGRAAAVERQLRETRSWMDQAKAQEIITWDETTLAGPWSQLVNFAQLASTETDGALLRLNLLSSETVEAVEQVMAYCAGQELTGHCLADAAAGVLWLRLQAKAGALAARLPNLHRQLVQRWPQTVVAAGAPEANQDLAVWGQPPAALSLMQTIKQRFDPQNLLNPGRYLL
jgi:D-lactate dehydrogenase (cytochrome)